MAIERPASRGTGAAAAFGRTLALGLVVVGACALLLARLDWIGDQFSAAFRTEKVDRTQPAILQAIEDLAEYHASSGVFEVVVDLEHDTKLLPSFVSGERTLFIAHGRVDGIIDFDGLAGDAIVADDARRTVTIRLPRPRLAAPTLDLERSRVFERRRGVLDRVGESLSNNPRDDRELHSLALQRLQSAAAASDVSRRAEINTEAMLRGLMSPLGYAVTIEWFEPVTDATSRTSDGTSPTTTREISGS